MSPLYETTLESLEWAQLTAALAQRIGTEYGRRAAEGLAPLGKPAAVRKSLGRIAELSALVAERGPLEFGGVRFLDDLFERAEKEGRLEGPELRAVFDTQQTAAGIARSLRRAEEAPLLAWLADGLEYLNDLCNELSRSIREDGEVDERAYPELAELRREIVVRRESIHKHLERLIHSRALEPMLQDKIYSVRGSRYVVPIKADFKGQLKGIVHDVSASGATLFVEPQAVVEETNGLILAVKQHAAQVDAILRRLSEQVGAVAPTLRKNLAWLGQIDLIHAQARLSLDYAGTVPEVGEGQVIALRGVAHPLMLLDGAQPVRNDLTLGEAERALIVSGANTGGKTVLLKAVGLCLLLVQHGMPVPALAGSRVDLFSLVAADIGDQQNLSNSLSTFSAQIRTLAEMQRSAGPGAAILIDEILTGTEPQHGAALAGAVLEDLVARGALCLVTTHYGELKALAGRHEGFVNASVDFDIERLEPTYRLRPGVPGSSYAFSIAQRHGLAEGAVEKAQARLEAGGVSADSLLEQLHRQERGLHEREHGVSRQERHLQRELTRQAGRQTELDAREQALRRRERGQVGKELRDARRKVAEVIHELQRANSLREAGRVSEALREVEREVERAAAEPIAPPLSQPEEPFDPARVQAGDRVYVPSLQLTAVLVDLLERDGRAKLRVGSLTFEVPATELAQAPESQPGRRSGPVGPAVSGRRGASAADAVDGEAPPPSPILPGEDNTVDLRGLRLSVALERAERFFDLCVVKHVSPVLVIHGHGTGRLKTGLRQELEDNPYVAAFRPGEGREGGDGVTVVALKL